MLSIIPVSKDGSICLLAMRPYSKESIIKVDIEMTLANIFRLRDLSEPPVCKYASPPSLYLTIYK